MDCTSDGLAELDVSRDGSRIVIGQLISKDSKGNRYWHLYMNVGDSSKSIDLTPGTTSGVLYDGMTEDGSTVYFTTADRLNGEDTDNSADIYEAQVGSSSATLHLVSMGSGGAGNSDSCTPLPNSVNQHWNTTGRNANCDVVAVGGGGGVAGPKTAASISSAPSCSTAAPNPRTARPTSPTSISTVPARDAAIRLDPGVERHRAQPGAGRTPIQGHLRRDRKPGIRRGR